MIKNFGYKSCNLNRTFDAYDYVDSYVYTGVHDKIKFLKNGYSKVTDHVSREIRYKRITRAQGLKLINLYENQKVKFENLFINWLGINSEGLNLFYNEIRNKNIWKEFAPNRWKKYYPKPIYKDRYRKEKNIKNYYKINNTINDNKENNYIIFGKGI